jgi:hypothetical protein
MVASDGDRLEDNGLMAIPRGTLVRAVASARNSLVWP